MYKIISKEVKVCTDSEGKETKVLELFYSIWKDTWKVLVKEYNEEHEETILKQIKKAVMKQYKELKK